MASSLRLAASHLGGLTKVNPGAFTLCGPLLDSHEAIFLRIYRLDGKNSVERFTTLYA